MNNSQEMANIIRIETKKNKINISKMLSDLGLGKNVMSHLDNGSMLKAESLCKIADYLNISVDYLLGRTEEPKSNIQTGNNNGDNNNSSVNINNKTDKDNDELFEMIKGLSLVERAKVIVMIDEMKKEGSIKNG